MKSKEMKDLLIVNLICIIAFIILSIVISGNLYNNYKESLEINNNYLAEELIEKNPELSESIKTVMQSLDYSEYNQTFKIQIIKNNLTITIISLVILSIINIIYIFQYYKKIENANNYINNVLNNNYSIDVEEFLKKDIGTFKKNVHSLVLKLQEQNCLLDKEKHKLEQILDDIYNQMRLSNINIKVSNKNVSLRNEHQIERIEHLISGLIKLSKLDSGTTKLKFEKIKLSSLISKAIEPLKDVIQYKKINIKLNIRNTDVLVDISWMSEAIFNIIKNACQYTKDEIVIESNNNAEYTEIRISNNGKIIEDKNLPHLFEKFQNTSTEGVGIGLNLTKEIIERQNGTIEVLNDDLTTFVIKLYKKQ